MNASPEGALDPGALFALRHVRSASLSPGAKYAAYCVSSVNEEARKEAFEIRIQNTQSGEEFVVKLEGDASWPAWSPDGSTLAFIAAVSGEPMIALYEPITKKLKLVDQLGGVPQGPLAWSPDGKQLAFAIVEQGEKDAPLRFSGHLFRADGIGFLQGLKQEICIAEIPRDFGVASVRLTRLATGSRMAMKPVFSPDGKRLLFQGTDEAIPFASYSPNLFCADLGSKRVTKLLGDDWFIIEAAWAPDGKRIIVAGAYKSKLTVPVIDVWTVEIASGRASCRTSEWVGNVGFRIHHDMPNWEATQLVHLAMMGPDRVHTSVQRGGRTEIWSIGLSGPIDLEVVNAGNRSCILLDADAQSGTSLFLMTDLFTPGELFLTWHLDRSERQITTLNSGAMSDWPALSTEVLQIHAPDELPIEGWVLRRTEINGPMPAILFIHGGPYSATGQAFRFDLAMLASHGFAVVFSNFRGSAGYGESFVEIMQGDWGRNGFPDHMATIDYAIKDGWADPDRSGVWGASHGGFATAWIVGQTSRFKAAIAEASVTNFATAYYLSDAPGAVIKEMGVRPDEDPELYRRRSPLTYAPNCTTPTLMLHGANDLRAPLAEAEQFYRALLDHDCISELEIIPDANHLGDSFGPISARLRQNQVLLNWFKRFV